MSGAPDPGGLVHKVWLAMSALREGHESQVISRMRRALRRSVQKTGAAAVKPPWPLIARHGNVALPSATT
jgi:hypothetical protein